MDVGFTYAAKVFGGSRGFFPFYFVAKCINRIWCRRIIALGAKMHSASKPYSIYSLYMRNLTKAVNAAENVICH